ncbi:MAG: putative PurR-regulated permease PerM [Paracoccaceae bacterium]|jgi:predicted PurR-regulated permease PerM
MALPIRNQLIYWLATLVVFFLLLSIFGSVLLPFLIGGAIAYFLDPVADRLESWGLGRAAAVSVISALSTLVVILLFIAVFPMLYRQLSALINAAPDMFVQLQKVLVERFPSLMDQNSVVRETLVKIGQSIQARGGDLVNSVVGSALGLVNILVLLVVVPVVAFYLLLDWDNILVRIDELLPRDHAPAIRRLAHEIDGVLAAFVRGQLSVCVVLGSFYAAALMLAGLQFGLIVGAIAGAITFIPYVGALIGGALAIGLAMFQFWGETNQILMVAGIFIVGQFLEGNVITPHLVGNSVGLHPVWLMFSLAAFGSLFGFVGLLVAVPVAASLGVLIRFGLSTYVKSPLHLGVDHRHSPADSEPK